MRKTRPKRLQSQQSRNCTNKRAPQYTVPLCTLAWLPQHSRRPAVIRPALNTSNRNRHARCSGRVSVGFRESRPTRVSQDWTPIAEERRKLRMLEDRPQIETVGARRHPRGDPLEVVRIDVAHAERN